MKGFGVFLSTLGIAGLILALSMDPGVDSPIGRVVNFHKATERQNYIIISSVLFIGGLILFGFGAVAEAKTAEFQPSKPATNTPLPTLNIVKDLTRDETEPLKDVPLSLAMSHAVSHGHVAATEKLLNQGVDANDHSYGINWLHIACINGHEAIVKLLVARGADPNLKDRYGTTPMSHAEDADHNNIVALLRELGAKA